MSKKDVVDDVLSSVCVMLNEAEPVLELIYMVEDGGRVVELKHKEREMVYDSNLMRLLKENNKLIEGVESFLDVSDNQNDNDHDAVSEEGVEAVEPQENASSETPESVVGDISSQADDEEELSASKATSKASSGLCDIANSMVQDATLDMLRVDQKPDNHFCYEALRSESNDLSGHIPVSHISNDFSERDVERSIEERLMSRVEDAIAKRMDEMAEKIAQKLRNGE